MWLSESEREKERLKSNPALTCLTLCPSSKWQKEKQRKADHALMEGGRGGGQLLIKV